MLRSPIRLVCVHLLLSLLFDGYIRFFGVSFSLLPSAAASAAELQLLHLSSRYIRGGWRMLCFCWFFLLG